MCHHLVKLWDLFNLKLAESQEKKNCWKRPKCFFTTFEDPTIVVTYDNMENDKYENCHVCLFKSNGRNIWVFPSNHCRRSLQTFGVKKTQLSRICFSWTVLVAYANKQVQLSWFWEKWLMGRTMGGQTQFKWPCHTAGI